MSIIRPFGPVPGSHADPHAAAQPGRGVVAVVESPAQLLNVIEWAWSRRDQAVGDHAVGDHAVAVGRFAAGIRVCVLAPTAELPRHQLSEMCALARGVGFDVTWLDVRGGADARLKSIPGLVQIARQARTLVLGDPFSGALQLLLTTSSAAEVVVVDDGSATIEFAKLISSGADLLRWHTNGQASVIKRQLAGAASRRLGARSGGFELFTAMPVEADQLPATVRLVHHGFGWIRDNFGPPTLRVGADLIGSSLTESGVIGDPQYLRAVATLSRRYGVDRYLAHRKESVDKLDRIAGLGLEIVRPDLPLELMLRAGPVGSTLISFPSTVVHTLPVVLAGTAVRLLTCDVDQRWFTQAHATRTEAGQFLSGVTATARRDHGLDRVVAA